MKAYLSGAIEKADDDGATWRKALTPRLTELGCEVFNPLEYFDSSEKHQQFQDLRKIDFKQFQNDVQELIEFDVDEIENLCDIVIVYYDELAGPGTNSEITIAYLSGTPVYMVTSMKEEELSNWTIGCVTKIYPNFDELLIDIFETT